MQSALSFCSIILSRLQKEEKEELMEQQKPSVSLLLGAGFSAPMGYPLAKELNNKIITFYKEYNAISSNGELCFVGDYNPTFDNYMPLFSFCKTFIQRYKSEVGDDFDYEVFYDVMVNEYKTHAYEHLYTDIKNYHKYVSDMEMVFNQIIEAFIRDGNKTTWYEKTPPDKTLYGKYKSFIDIVQLWSRDKIINVHTLNHDLLFEAFNNDYLSGMISDGFSIEQSPYYGKSENESICLERYIEKYDTPIHLYKLHGSIDYVIYFDLKNNFLPKDYIKIKQNVRIDDLLEKQADGSFEHFVFANNSDILSGEKTKMKRYKEPLFYSKVINFFQQNLQTADKIIIIGYSGGDAGINRMIVETKGLNNKKVFLVDPYPNVDFANSINATIIKKSIECITFKDLE